jgi:hypothetical protein
MDNTQRFDKAYSDQEHEQALGQLLKDIENVGSIETKVVDSALVQRRIPEMPQAESTRLCDSTISAIETKPLD